MIFVARWLKQRWRFLLILLTPLVLLPIPIVGNSPVCGRISSALAFFNRFVLASEMWIYCTDSNYLLDF